MSDTKNSSAANPPPPAGVDRRQWTRFPFQPQTGCYLTIKGQKAIGPVAMKNISAGGIFLALDERTAPGSLLTITLYNKVLKHWKTLEVRVVYVISDPGGKYWVGCAFTQLLGEEEVQAFL